MRLIGIIESYRNDIIKTTQELVKIKSIEGKAKPNMPFGEGPYEALKFILNLCKEIGFRTKNFDNYAGHADLGKEEKVVGVLVHLDVVPEGNGWDFPPYGGEIHNDKIYGRGTIDNKGPAVACIYAMKALKESGIDLNKRIRIIFGTNEETRWECMKHYLKYENAPNIAFTPDAEFPVIYGEKGIITFDLIKKLEPSGSHKTIVQNIKGGHSANMVPDYCEALLKTKEPNIIKERLNSFIKKTGYPLHIEKRKTGVRVIANGVSAHGSTPEKGENAISYLMSFLGELIVCNCSVHKFIETYNKRIGFKHHGENIGCGFKDDISGKLNFNPGIINGNENEIRLTINVRYPIKSSAKEVYGGIRENLIGTDIELVEGNSNMKPLYIPESNFLVKRLMEVYHQQTGDIKAQPITIGGGTYARAMNNAVAFGPVFPEQEEVAHQANEFISIEHLMKITKIYAQALYELTK